MIFAQTVAPQGGAIVSLLPLIMIFFVFYFLLIMPQQKKQKAHKKMLEELSAIEVDTAPFEVAIAKPNAAESHDWLYDSSRAYLDQIPHYKAHKNGEDVS